MKSLFLIDRGASRMNWIAGPLYPRVVVSDSSRVARRLAGDTFTGASVWQNFSLHNKNSGLLLIRWTGLDVDYGTEIRPSVLSVGIETGFHHRDNKATWGLFESAVWWSSAPVPKWLVKIGVTGWKVNGEVTEPAVYKQILDDEAAASAKEAGNRPFGFRALQGWKALATTPTFRDQWLPGLVSAEA